MANERVCEVKEKYEPTGLLEKLLSFFIKRELFLIKDVDSPEHYIGETDFFDWIHAGDRVIVYPTGQNKAVILDKVRVKK